MKGPAGTNNAAANLIFLRFRGLPWAGLFPTLGAEGIRILPGIGVKSTAAVLPPNVEKEL